MSEPRRLASVSPNALTRVLLDAGRDERPSREARLSAALAIGIGGSLATTAVAGGGAAGTGTATAVTSKWLGTMGVLKLVGSTIVSGALVVGVIHEQHEVAAPTDASSMHSVAGAARAAAGALSRPGMPASRTPALPAPPAEAVPAPAPSVAIRPPPPALSAPLRSDLAVAPSAASSREASPVSHGIASDSEGASLRDEVQALDGARAALADGHAATALKGLEAYDRAFPRGFLRDEAELLGIEAIAQTGNLLAAGARAEGLLARDEHGPHARRIRALLASLRRDSGAP